MSGCRVVGLSGCRSFEAALIAAKQKPAAACRKIHPGTAEVLTSMQEKQVYFYRIFVIFLMINASAYLASAVIFFIQSQYLKSALFFAAAILLSGTQLVNYRKKQVAFWSVYAALAIVLFFTLPSFWCFTGGLRGPIPFIFPLISVIIYMMGSVNIIILFLALEAAVFSVLVLLEHMYPQIIVYTFQEPFRAFVNSIFLVVSTILLLLIIRFYEKRYLVERNMLLRHNKVLEELTKADSMTGLLNQSAIKQKLSEEIRRVQRYGRDFAILLLDIDNFKKVNDTYGHAVGDEIICRTAEILLQHLRATDHIGRYGGDEFLVICPETDLHKAQAVAEKIAECFKDIRTPGGMSMTASIGAAVYSSDSAEDDEALFRMADNNLYTAKRNGKNRIVFSESADS